MTNFGASFKKARESKGISLDQIAMDTRISTRFLRAIENEEFHLLPGGIFNRGFVRAYAERVGLDPDQAVGDYERLSGVRDSAEVPAVGNALPNKSNRLLYPIAAGLLVIVIAIFYIVNRDAGQAAQTVSPADASPATVQPAPQAAPETSPKPEPIPATSPPPAPPEPEPLPAPKPQALTIDIEAREATWIKVTADGSSVTAGEILQPGMTRKFTAQASIDLSVGNAGGLSVKINDQTVKPLGKSGQVRMFKITPSNLKDFIG
jgi:cytoskeleton protein RodZ